MPQAISIAPGAMKAPSYPAFATIPAWCQLSSMSRSATYEAIGRRDLHTIKVGNRTLIDVEAGLAWLRSLPAAEVRAPRRKSAA